MIGQIILQMTCLILVFFFFLNISELNEIDNNYVELYNPKEVDEDFNSSTPLFLNSVKYLFK